MQDFARRGSRRLSAKRLAAIAFVGLLAFVAGGVGYGLLTARAVVQPAMIASPPASAATDTAAASAPEPSPARPLGDGDGLAADLNVARGAVEDARRQLHDALQERDQLAGELDVASRASAATADKLASLSAQADQLLVAEALLLVSNLKRNFVLQTVYQDLLPRLQPDPVAAAWLDQRDTFVAKSRTIAETTFSYYVDVVRQLAELDANSLAAVSNVAKADFSGRHIMLHEEYWPIVARHVRRLAQDPNALTDVERRHWQDEIYGRSDQETAANGSR